MPTQSGHRPRPWLSAGSLSVSVATIVAMALPSALDRAGRDPAFGSGPLATVIQDVLSILVYFTVALALVE